MDDHHVLITQLCAELDHNHRMLLDDCQVTHPLADRARAALAHQPDFRALCAELLLFSEQAGEICTCEGLWPKCDPNYTLLNRANAALAADGPAVPEGREPAAVVEQPSDEQIDLAVMAIQALTPHQPDATTHDLYAVDRGREILRQSLARWGHQSAPPAEGEPEVVGPTDEELWQVGDKDFRANTWPTDAIRYARAVLARWGHQPAPPAEGEVAELVAELSGLADYFAGEGYSSDWIIQLTRAADLLAQRHPAPVPVSELVDLAHELRKTSEYLRGGCGWNKAVEAIERAVDLIEGSALQRFAPVPVSERPWERKGWCDERGCCWWANKYPPFRWEYVNRAAVIDGVMLPAHALPLPAGEYNQGENNV